jgi:hypothetical protein
LLFLLLKIKDPKKLKFKQVSFNYFTFSISGTSCSHISKENLKKVLKQLRKGSKTILSRIIVQLRHNFRVSFFQTVDLSFE